MYNLVLLRHGRSEADDLLLHEGRYDSPLTQEGKDQANRTAKRIKEYEYSFDKIICSPLMRAKETALIIGEILGVPIEENNLLIECDNGILAGMKREEAFKKYPIPEYINPFRYFPENTGENEVLLHARGGVALNSIIENGPGNYLIIAHGGILNAIIRNMLKISYMTNNSGVVFKLKDNGFIDISYNENNDMWIVNRMEKGY